MAKVKLYGRRYINTVVDHLPGVHAAVGEAAKDAYKRSKARLAMHTDTGNAKVTLTEGDVDWFVNLDDKAAVSIEFGHWVKGKYEDPAKPKYVQGLYILSAGAGLPTTAKRGATRPRTRGGRR
ncbi:hypothetical protein SEA_STEPHIG9_17 [Mycobacterium phage Stephig9]|uniref:Uncharacterized protein n=1 Tax=Mycobacterium phage Stephig9 TaxID=2591224 RepID=A0A514DH76_9CAUD|nr:hypothetical protein SEA_STEPHIG9_17 [Mycobacterium phage Stephig9]